MSDIVARCRWGNASMEDSKRASQLPDDHQADVSCLHFIIICRLGWSVSAGPDSLTQQAAVPNIALGCILCSSQCCLHESGVVVGDMQGKAVHAEHLCMLSAHWVGMVYRVMGEVEEEGEEEAEELPHCWQEH